MNATIPTDARRAWPAVLVTSLLLLLLASPATAQNPFLRDRGELKITEIHYFGNHSTKEYVLQRELNVQVGDVYDDDALNEGWTRLEELEFIAYVDIQQKRPSPDEVILVIHVEEDVRFDLRPNISYDRRFDYIYGGEAELRNLRGRAEQLWLHAQWGHLHSYRAGWSNPWILEGARLGVGVSGHWERYDFVFEPFEFEDRGARLSLWRDLGRWVRVSGDFEYRSVEVRRSALAGLDDGTFIDPSLGFSLEHDSRDLRYYPSHGVHARVDAEFGGIGRDHDYQVYDFDLAAFYEIPHAGILAGHVGLRTASAALPIYRRSYLGGPQDVRGVEYSSLRGDEAYLATIELRRPIILVPLRDGRAVGVGVHGFADWGKTWEQAQSFEDVEVRHSAGFGLHLNLNTLNFRFEWAFSDDDGDSFVFEDRFTF